MENSVHDWDDDHFAETYVSMGAILNCDDVILNHLPAARGSALDLGCGGGRLVCHLADRFEQVTGVDISSTMVRIAAVRQADQGQVDFIQANIADWTDDRQYDFIVSINTLHHFKDLETVVKRIVSRLKPGGRLFISDVTAPLGRVILPLHMLHALWRWPINVFRIGPKNAWKWMVFRLSRKWMRHIHHDRLQTAKGFRRDYAALLPGATCFSFHGKQAVVWDRPVVKNGM